MDQWIEAALTQWYPRLSSQQLFREKDRVREWSERPDHWILPLTHPLCRPLRLLPKPPAILWGWGDLRALENDLVTVVGTRRVSPGGRRLARLLGQRLAAHGIGVVSGLALGVDGESHRGALESQGRTVAVLGGGFSHLYPRAHLPLASEIRGQGGLLLSEFPPDLGPRPFHFPRRNRILGALGRATVLVEAGEKSGAHSTLEWALHCHREVWVAPMDGDGREGNRRWLAEGARPLLDWRGLLGDGPTLAFPYSPESEILRRVFQRTDGAATLERLIQGVGTSRGASLVFGAVERGEVVELGGPWFGWVAD